MVICVVFYVVLSISSRVLVVGRGLMVSVKLFGIMLFVMKVDCRMEESRYLGVRFRIVVSVVMVSIF